MKLIYVAHPYQGKQENMDNVENIILDLQKEHIGKYVFISPIHTLGYMYNIVHYDIGMEMCIELLKHCDEVWFCPNWEDSKGCNIEHIIAKTFDKPIKYIPKGD